MRPSLRRGPLAHVIVAPQSRSLGRQGLSWRGAPSLLKVPFPNTVFCRFRSQVGDKLVHVSDLPRSVHAQGTDVEPEAIPIAGTFFGLRPSSTCCRRDRSTCGCATLDPVSYASATLVFRPLAARPWPGHAVQSHAEFAVMSGSGRTSGGRGRT
jgi:hypothetical protein